MIRALALSVALAFATPAVAGDFLVKCVSNCPAKASAGLRAPGDLQLGDVWWFGPSLGLSLAARDSSTRTWETGIALSFQYGIHWRPTWSPTPTFLSLNLGLAAGSTNAFQTGGVFALTVPITVTILDLLQIGYGPRFRFATNPDQKDSISGVFFLGLATSFGAP